MLEAPEVEPHMHHKTGHSLADKILGVTAIFLSGVSVFIAVHHGQTMERLVEANSWPNISYSTGNTNDAGTRDDITLTLKNTGVGPARIDSFELFYKGAAMSGPLALMHACCAKDHMSFSVNTVTDEVMPARDSVSFLTLAKDANRPETWNALNTERAAIEVRVCYCSVFDECWARDTRKRRPEQVAECKPSQAVSYDYQMSPSK